MPTPRTGNPVVDEPIAKAHRKVGSAQRFLKALRPNFANRYRFIERETNTRLKDYVGNLKKGKASASER